MVLTSQLHIDRQGAKSACREVAGLEMSLGQRCSQLEQEKKGSYLLVEADPFFLNLKLRHEFQLEPRFSKLGLTGSSMRIDPSVVRSYSGRSVMDPVRANRCLGDTFPCSSLRRGSTTPKPLLWDSRITTVFF